MINKRGKCKKIRNTNGLLTSFIISSFFLSWLPNLEDRAKNMPFLHKINIKKIRKKKELPITAFQISLLLKNKN